MMYLEVARMKLNQWKSRAELEEIQEQKLRDIVSYASRHITYYKNLELKSLDNLPSLPIITKRDVRSNTDSLISDQYGKASLLSISTAGSTGTPLSVYYTEQENRQRVAIYQSRMIEAGVRPFDLNVRISYKEYPPAFAGSPLFRSRFISMYDEEKEILSALRRLRPRTVYSYPSVLTILAHKNMDPGFDVKVDRILSNAEVLSDRARELISRSFGCSIRNLYGANETGPIAFECEKGSMHVHSDSMIVEVVDGRGDSVKGGRYGRAIVTPLWKRSMPLIRYALDDRIALAQKCSCGRGSHVLKPIQGRDNDFITLPSGKVSNFLPDVHLRDFPGILMYSINQERPGHLCIKIIPEKAIEPDNIRKSLAAFFPEPMDIEIEAVDELPRGRRGKIRVMTSKVRPDFSI